MQRNFFDGNRLWHDLWTAYYEARKKKRNTLNAIQFERDLEHNMYMLYREVAEYRYQISPSICFIVDDPVKREIFAAHFRDRIIHHYIIGRLMPIFENQFIYDTYSCRKGKGTLFGINRLEHFMRSATENYTREAYILKLDLSGFFMSINKVLLWEMVRSLIVKKYKGYDKEILLYLTECVIMNDPTVGCKVKGHRSDWEGLPPNKSLFHAQKGWGLPIGNLTSQVFANYYLTPFDRYIKETLKIKCYGRYVDDFFIIHRDKKFLLQLMLRVKNYLMETVSVKLHPRKCYLQLCSHGVTYLGCHLNPFGKFLAHRVKNNLWSLLWELNDLSHAVRHSDEAVLCCLRFNSYYGLRHHYNAWRICQAGMLKMPDWYFEGSDGHILALSDFF